MEYFVRNTIELMFDGDVFISNVITRSLLFKDVLNTSHMDVYNIKTISTTLTINPKKVEQEWF